MGLVDDYLRPRIRERAVRMPGQATETGRQARYTSRWKSNPGQSYPCIHREAE